MSNYSLKALKVLATSHGYSYTCTLLRDGKAVAKVEELGRGGEMQIFWLDTNDKATVKFRDYQDVLSERNGTKEEAMFEAFVMTLPKIKGFNDSLMNTSAHIVIDDMVNDTNTNTKKKISSELKRKVIYENNNG